jgi:cytochrome P450
MDAQHYALYAASAAAVYGAYHLAKVVANPSALRNLPGPPSPSLLWGNFWEFRDASKDGDNVDELKERWAVEHGHTYMYRGLFSVGPPVRHLYVRADDTKQASRLHTTDVKALSHILMRAEIYAKPEELRLALSRMMGEGILVIEGDKHRVQRRLLNPAFGPGQIRELTGVFLDKANEVRRPPGCHRCELTPT